ncbi:sulfurtransferase complex subunit TusB [Litoribrevibacter albus]|uniref:sulfurtransferase complex subunit TusB n=1 Tax=Litoribrevibacter albus TaxID=1473156 RepID=UPI003D69EEE7
MNLHLVFSSPYKHSALQDCLKVVQKSDAILLIEDGVFAVSHPEYSDKLNCHPCYALESDLESRGINTPNSVAVINYDDFVELTLQFDKTISWR